METHLWEADHLNNCITESYHQWQSPIPKTLTYSLVWLGDKLLVWGQEGAPGCPAQVQMSTPWPRRLLTLLAVSFPYQAQQHLTREQL